MAKGPGRSDGETEAADPQQAPNYDILLRIAWQGKWLLLLGLVLGLVGGSFYAFRGPPVYQSSTQVLVVKKRQPNLPIQQMDPYSYFEDYLGEHIVLIKSPLIVGRAVKKYNLQLLKSFGGQADPTSAIISQLSVTRDMQNPSGASNHLLNLAFKGPDPQECYLVLKAIEESYEEFLEETYHNVGQETVKLIGEASTVLQKDLAHKEQEYQEFRQNGPVLARGKDGGTIHQETLATLQSSRSALLVRKAVIRGRIEAIAMARRKGYDQETLFQMVLGWGATNSELDDGFKKSQLHYLQEKLQPLLLLEKEYLKKYGPDHPELRALKEKIETTCDLYARPSRAWSEATKRQTGKDLETSVEDFVTAYVRSLEQQLESIELEEKSLAELARREEDETRKMVNYVSRDEMLKNDLARTQQLYDSVVKRLSEVNLIKDMGGYDAKVVVPVEEGARLAPNAVPKVLMFGFFGLLAGFGAAYGADRLNRSFHSPEEIRRWLRVPVVAHVPMLAPDKQASLKVRAKGAPAYDPLLCTYYSPTSTETEAYRSVRTSLYFSTQGAGSKVIQITSPEVGDGKTVLSANLAVSIAQSGEKVILLDADFRRSRQQKMFGVPNQVGLSTVLQGKATLEQAVQPSGIPGLTVLPAGKMPSNPAELLTSPRFEELLETLRQTYDFVIIDTPPLLAVTDPCMVAPRVDGVLLTLRIAKNSRPNAERATEVLAALGAHVLGIVVNGVDGSSGYGSYAYGLYQYGYEYKRASGYEAGDGQEIPAAHDDGPAQPPTLTNGHGPGKPNGRSAPRPGRDDEVASLRPPRSAEEAPATTPSQPPADPS